MLRTTVFPLPRDAILVEERPVIIPANGKYPHSDSQMADSIRLHLRCNHFLKVTAATSRAYRGSVVVCERSWHVYHNEISPHFLQIDRPFETRAWSEQMESCIKHNESNSCAALLYIALTDKVQIGPMKHVHTFRYRLCEDCCNIEPAIEDCKHVELWNSCPMRDRARSSRSPKQLAYPPVGRGGDGGEANSLIGLSTPFRFYSSSLRSTMSVPDYLERANTGSSGAVVGIWKTLCRARRIQTPLSVSPASETR